MKSEERAGDRRRLENFTTIKTCVFKDKVAREVQADAFAKML